MRKYFSLLLAGAAILVMNPLAAFAQEQEEPEPEIHYITATVFDVPSGEKGQKVWEYIESVIVPLNQLDPNVLHSSVLTHNWGSNSAEVVLVAEYADWAAIEASCGEPCRAWFEENQPEEGTPEREEWDAMAQAFSRAYNGHRDEIYEKSMDWAK